MELLIGGGWKQLERSGIRSNSDDSAQHDWCSLPTTNSNVKIKSNVEVRVGDCRLDASPLVHSWNGMSLLFVIDYGCRPLMMGLWQTHFFPIKAWWNIWAGPWASQESSSDFIGLAKQKYIYIYIFCSQKNWKHFLKQFSSHCMIFNKHYLCEMRVSHAFGWCSGRWFCVVPPQQTGAGQRCPVMLSLTVTVNHLRRAFRLQHSAVA